MSEIPLPFVIFPLFFIVAFVYSSVGHGGASGYLALFALFGIATPAVAPVALMLNVIVASTGWWRYWKSGYFSGTMLLPFIVASIPAAFLGGLITLSPRVFSLILGLALLWAAIRLAIVEEIKAEATANPVVSSQQIWVWGIPIGGGIGLLSGLVGIGGGIFLSPILLFLRWADVKRTAALSSAFIVLNSMSGLAGHLTRSSVDLLSFFPYALAVTAGGFLGAHTGAVRLRPKTLQVLLAIVLVVAGVKLVSKIF